jgi:hypothetical protein
MARIRVLIFLVAVVALFQAGVTTAQMSLFEKKEESTRYFYLAFDYGVDKTSLKPEAREDWRQMFLPPSSPPYGGMTISYDKSPGLTLGIELGYIMVLAGNSQSWQIRLPISYQIFSFGKSNYFAKEKLASATLDWWNSVKINDLFIEHFTPRVGINIGKGNYGIGFSVQHYRLIMRDYLGENHYGAANTSRVISSRQIESGISLRADLLLGGPGVIDAYMETMGGFDTVSFGLAMRVLVPCSK